MQPYLSSTFAQHEAGPTGLAVKGPAHDEQPTMSREQDSQRGNKPLLSALVERFMELLEDSNAQDCSTFISACHRLGWEPSGDYYRAA